MFVIRRVEIIHRPVEEVFKFVATDYFENRAKWAPESPIEKTSEGPMGLGSTGRASAKDAYGRDIEFTFVVTEYEPNRKMVARNTYVVAKAIGDASQGRQRPSTEVESSITLEPVAAGTKAIFTYKVWHQGVSRFYGPFMRSADAGFRRAIHESIDRMMHTLEGPSRERDLRGLLRRVPYGWIAYALAFVALFWMHSARTELGLTATSLTTLQALLSGMILFVVACIWVMRSHA